MKVFYCCLLLLGVGALANKKVKRQASYTFPGPRSERAHRPSANAAPVYVEEHEERDVIQRRQFQAQPVQPQYAPAQARAPPPAAPVAPPAPPPPAYETSRAASPAAAPAVRRRASQTNNRNKYGPAPQQSLNGNDPNEEQGPDPLTLLLEDSHFSCSGKSDGYYADDTVNCQVFHYCVGGAKHSWMCPENTVFHQVHLNCVPDAQDICSQSEKFHFVNDYLYKPVDYQGPNNTARYSQRYYPDGYVVGDPIVTPQDQAPRRQAQQSNYAPPPPAPRAPARQIPVAAPPPPPPPPQPTYRAQPQSSPSYNQAPQSRPASRPSRPAESYSDESPQGYRASSRPESSPSPQAYRQSQAQSAQRQPSAPAYRPVSSPVSAPIQEDSPASHSRYSSEENVYQPQSQPQARRSAAAAQQPRPTAGYAPPRQQYRATARSSSAAAYPAYSSNQAAGVQYDEDY